MRKSISVLLGLMMLFQALPALSEGQRAPDYILEGFDNAANGRDWETNLFFERMQERTGISFQFRQHTEEEDWKQRRKEILAGEDLPDVLFKAGLTQTETREMAESGILIDLKPLLPEYAPDLWALLEANPEYMNAVTLPDGSIRALPAVNELPNNDLMWINTEWLKNLRLEAPNTAEELTEVLRAFRTGDPNRNGRADEVPLTFIGMWELRFLGHAFGIIDNDYYLSVKDGQVVSALTTERNRAFLTWLHQLWEEGLLDHKGFSTVDSLRQITDSKAAMIYGVLLSNSPLTVVPSEALSQYGTLMPLEYEGGRTYRSLLGPLTRGTFALTRTCAEPEKMLSWVNLLYTAEGSRMLQVGLEGEEYFWNEDGRWEWMADLQTVANDVLPNATLSEGGNAPGIIETEFQSRYDDAQTRNMIDEMVKVRDAAAMPYPLVTLTAEDEARVARLQAEIAPYAEHAMAEFVTGDREITDAAWEEFARGAEERGLSEMLSIWQKYVRE